MSADLSLEDMNWTEVCGLTSSQIQNYNWNGCREKSCRWKCGGWRVSIQSFQNWNIYVWEDFNGTWDRRQLDRDRPPGRNTNFANYFDCFGSSLHSVRGINAGYDPHCLSLLLLFSIFLFNGLLYQSPELFRLILLPRVFTDYVIPSLKLCCSDITTLHWSSELLIILLIIWRERSDL